MKGAATGLVMLIFVVGLAAMACRGEGEEPTPTVVPPTKTLKIVEIPSQPPTKTPEPTPEPVYANPELLVSTAWLAEHLSDTGLVVVDVRKPDKYAAGHIPGSVNLVVSDKGGPFYDQDHPVDWMILPQADFAAAIGALGIDNDTTVVAYDDFKGLWASRFFWALEYYGHDKARVLDGGFKKWEAESRALTEDVPQVVAATFQAEADPSKYATKDSILGALDDADTVLVATVGDDEFTGKKETAKRGGGHIPGAQRIDWVENLTDDEAPVFKSAAELTQLYESGGITKDKNVVVY